MPRPLFAWRRCAVSLGLALTALGACAQEAVVCSLVGLPETVVHQGGRPLQLPVQELKPCDGLKVVAGEAVDQKASGLTPREWRELMDVLGR